MKKITNLLLVLAIFAGSLSSGTLKAKDDAETLRQEALIAQQRQTQNVNVAPVKVVEDIADTLDEQPEVEQADANKKNIFGRICGFFKRKNREVQPDTVVEDTIVESENLDNNDDDEIIEANSQPSRLRRAFDRVRNSKAGRIALGTALVLGGTWTAIEAGSIVFDTLLSEDTQKLLTKYSPEFLSKAVRAITVKPETVVNGIKVAGNSIANGSKIAYNYGMNHGGRKAGNFIADHGGRRFANGTVKYSKIAGNGIANGGKIAGNGIVRYSKIAGNGIAKGAKATYKHLFTPHKRTLGEKIISYLGIDGAIRREVAMNTFKMNTTK